MTSYTIISDVHGNARALRAALAAAREQPSDRMVFLGDLLTYGHDVEEVLALVHEAQERYAAVLLIGNHDQMYFDLADGRRQLLDGLPDWIQESVSLTLDSLDTNSFADKLRWRHEWIDESILFAHANPFGLGDWRYMNSRETYAAAATELGNRGVRLGVFGHTHRGRWLDPETEVPVDTSMHAELRRPTVTNAGAVGQPREARALSIIMRLTVKDDGASATFEQIKYDVKAHLDGLRRSSLSAETIARLTFYFMARE